MEALDIMDAGGRGGEEGARYTRPRFTSHGVFSPSLDLYPAILPHQSLGQDSKQSP